MNKNSNKSTTALRTRTGTNSNIKICVNIRRENLAILPQYPVDFTLSRTGVIQDNHKT
jgi:hypothetical protein